MTYKDAYTMCKKADADRNAAVRRHRAGGGVQATGQPGRRDSIVEGSKEFARALPNSVANGAKAAIRGAFSIPSNIASFVLKAPRAG